MWQRLVIPLIAIGCAASSGAVQLAHTPVQDAFAASLATSDWRGSTSRLSESRFRFQEGDFTETDHQANHRKSVFKAGLYSVLVPGGGQYYLGYRKKARYFFVTEALTWIGFASFRVYGSWKEDDYIRYAAIHADARLEDKDDDFCDFVGFYDDIDQYNTLGRIWDPDRPYLEDTPDNHWRWESETHRATYRELKNRSREAYRRAEFMIGIAIVSRIVSVIDAVRDAKRARRQLDDRFSRHAGKKLRLALDPFCSGNQIRLTLTTDF